MATHPIFSYLGMGYKLIPLEPGAKRPLSRLAPAGLRDASADKGVVARWQASAPTANWGLLPPEQVLILDVDKPELLPDLLATYPTLATAPCQRTPRGGAHIFVATPPAVAASLSASTHVIDGVDIRGLGKAYVVVAPSTVAGRRYAWERELRPPDELPLIPDELLKRLLPPPKPAPPPIPPTPPAPTSASNTRLAGLLNWAAREAAATPPGNRHNTLLRLSRLVGGWLHHGLSEGEALAALVQAGMASGLPEEEARNTVRDGLAHGAQEPLPLPPDDNPRAALSYLPPPPAAERSAANEGRAHPLDGLSSGDTVPNAPPGYRVEGGRIQALQPRTGDYRPLANFACIVKREIRATDGLETDMLFELEGYLDSGLPLPRATVRAAEFGSMAWVPREWGAAAIVAPGPSAKDHLRAAIQYLSRGRTEQATVYRHLGWTKIAGRWHYLHAGGAIADDAPEQVEVSLGRSLEGFVLPDPPSAEDEPRHISALWELRRLAPNGLALLLYALAAPLGHIPYSLYLAGPTGAHKTSLALVMQSLFGYRAPTPPLGWEATANALEATAFAAKDCLLLIDDYAPTGSDRAQKELQAKAARLLRSQGNAVGRLRMRADGSMAGDRPPRGALLMTGEDLPPGHSVRARALFLELRRGEVDLARLSQAQALAREGVYAMGMAGWIRHLSRRLEEYQGVLRGNIDDLRPRWTAEHRRTTDALAHLYAVWELYAEYAALHGVDLTVYEGELDAVLAAIRDAQSEYQQDANPTERALKLLRTALTMGRCHMAPISEHPTDPVEDYLDHPDVWGWQYRQPTSDLGKGIWVPQGPQIGWVPRDWEQRGIYLDPSAAWTVLNRLATEQGEPLPSERTFWRGLAERGIISATEWGNKTRYRERITVHGARIYVVHIPTIPSASHAQA